MINADDDDTVTDELEVFELEDSLSDAEKVPDLPPGVYTAEIQDVQKKTSDRGNDYYAIKFVVPEGKLPGDMKEFYPDGAPLYWNRQMADLSEPRARFNMKQLYIALGLDTNVKTINPNDWMGRSARLKVVHEKFKGNNQVSVKSIESAEVERPAAAERGATRAKTAARRGR